jgi:hypothetical protein
LLIAAAGFVFFAKFFIRLNFKRGLGKIFELRRNLGINNLADVIIALG